MRPLTSLHPQARARHSACLLGLNYCIFGACDTQPTEFSRRVLTSPLDAGGTDGNKFLNDIVLLDTENMT
jgi:hypothetical protein